MYKFTKINNRKLNKNKFINLFLYTFETLKQAKLLNYQNTNRY